MPVATPCDGQRRILLHFLERGRARVPRRLRGAQLWRPHLRKNLAQPTPMSTRRRKPQARPVIRGSSQIVEQTPGYGIPSVCATVRRLTKPGAVSRWAGRQPTRSSVCCSPKHTESRVKKSGVRDEASGGRRPAIVADRSPERDGARSQRRLVSGSAERLGRLELGGVVVWSGWVWQDAQQRRPFGELRTDAGSGCATAPKSTESGAARIWRVPRRVCERLV
jgi:hypothetical protein